MRHANIYHDNSKKFPNQIRLFVDITGELQCDSLDVDGSSAFSGNLNLDDSVSCVAVINADLDIYHDGGNSWVREQGTGALLHR